MRRWMIGLFAGVLLASGCNFAKMGLSAMERQTHRKGYTEHVLETDDFRLRYWVGGSGSPLLMLHGFGGDGVSNWRAQLDPFAEARTVIVPDLLWFGQSEGFGSPSLEAQARAQLALLDHLGHEKTDIVNVSYGGFVTLMMFYLAPDRVGKVVFQDTPGPFYTPEQQRAFLDQFGVEHAADIFAVEEPDDVRVLFEILYYDEPKIPGFVLMDIHEAMFAEHQDAKRALLADLETARAGDWREDLPQLVGQMEPPLVIWGRHDPVFPVSSGQQLADATGGQLVVIEFADHGPSVERPDEFNAAALRYLLGSP